MTMTNFRTWLIQDDNQSFWRQPLPSEKLDNLLCNEDIQKSIAKSRKDQEVYGYIESIIVLNYARLIDYKLREAFKSLSIDEFKNPSGFECKSKSSEAQKKYFELRNQLEFFLKNDIQQHRGNPDAELNAFRRWIEVAEMLLQRHCYEGFILIGLNIELISRPDLINGLPKGLRKSYLHICELNLPDGNHAALRAFMKSHQNTNDFSPLILNSHAITSLNEANIRLRESQLILNFNKKELAGQISKAKKDRNKEDKYENHEIKNLLRKRREMSREIKKIDSIVEGQLLHRDRILEVITKEQQQPLRAIPPELEATYSQIKKRFEAQKADKETSVIRDQPLRKRKSTPSTLYSDKLLPSLWKRNGITENQHWESVFVTRNLK